MKGHVAYDALYGEHTSHPSLDSAVTRYCPLWAPTTPSRNFLVCHQSWDCSRPNSLNFGVPMKSEASEFPKGFVLYGGVHLHIGHITPSPLVYGPNILVSTLTPHGKVALIPFCHISVGHPSYDCSHPNSLNFRVMMEFEAGEFPKSLVLYGDGHGISPRLRWSVWDVTIYTIIVFVLKSAPVVYT
ncbi:hypothetical protein DVH24_012295 [Malus domestica]|uniref:Uncharacterized protein n=1 Tax=Malus domestica TaxID=3750 RepID=A0A498HTZ7_MALDO|nr:hypothetical protein DVH24_012295 [Malus domestica]